MEDKHIKHLNWIYERIKHVHNEGENYDYMIRFREIIEELRMTNQLPCIITTIDNVLFGPCFEIKEAHKTRGHEIKEVCIFIGAFIKKAMPDISIEIDEDDYEEAKQEALNIVKAILK